MLKQLCSIALLSILLFGASGCASFNRIADYPKANQPTSATVVAKPLSKMTELPIGAHYDKDRQIVVSGHQKGMLGGLLFGVVGVIVVDQMNKSSGEKQFGQATHNSTTDLGTLTQNILEEEKTAGRAPNWTATDAGTKLQLSPYAVVTVQKSGKARLYAMLRAELLDAKGQSVWFVRYFARAPGEYAVDGPDGWMTGDRFVEGMQTALRRTVQVCLADSQGRLTGSTKIKAKGALPYLNIENLELNYIAVQETQDDIVARLAAGDALVMAGTHVLSRSDYTISPADFKDPRK